MVADDISTSLMLPTESLVTVPSCSHADTLEPEAIFTLSPVVLEAISRVVLPFFVHGVGVIPVDAAISVVQAAFAAHSAVLGEADALAWAGDFIFDPGIGHRDMRRLRAAGSLAAMQRISRDSCTRPGLTAARFAAFDKRFGTLLEPELRAVLRSFAIEGVPTLVDPAFSPNGSAPKPRAKYIRIHQAYHKNIAALHANDVVWIMPSKELRDMVGDHIHFNANHWVLKGGTPAGRSIQDTSAAEPGFWPLNHDGVKEQAEAAWGTLRHPTILQLIVDVVLAARKKFAVELAAGEQLVLWKMDLKGAFNLLQVAPDSVHLWAFELLGDLTMIFPVGCFGWTNYPHAFGVLTLCLEAAVASLLRGFVKAYVDDFMGCCLSRDVHADMDSAREVFVLLLGKGSVAEPKSVFGRRLTWIGWELDLDSSECSLAIGASLLLKAVHVFFSIDSAAVTRHEMEKISSYAGRFSLVFPFLKPFVAALYAEYSGRSYHASFQMSTGCLEALEAWRFFLLASHILPARFNRSLQSFVTKDVALTLVWDASLYGIGATLFEGDGVDGKVLKVVKIPLDPFDYPFQRDSQFQNLSEYLGVTVSIALAIRLGYAGCGLRIVGDSVTALQWTAEGTYVAGFHDRAAVVQATLRSDAEVCITKRDWLSGENNSFCDNLSRRYDPSFSDADVSASVDSSLLCTLESDPWISSLLHLSSAWRWPYFEGRSAQLLHDAASLSAHIRSLGNEAKLRRRLQTRLSSMAVASGTSVAEVVWRPAIILDDMIDLRVSSSFANVPRRELPRVSRHILLSNMYAVVATAYNVPSSSLSLRLLPSRRILSQSRDGQLPLSSFCPMLCDCIEVEWFGQLLGGAPSPTVISEDDMALVSSTLRGAVQMDKGNSYDRGWRYWLAFLQPRQSEPNPFLSGDSMKTKVQLLVLFWHHLRVHKGLSAPGPLMSGVRHFFRMEQEDLSIFHHETLAAARTSLRELARVSSMHRLTGTGSRRLRSVPSVEFLGAMRRESFAVPRTVARRDMVVRSNFCTYLASATMLNFGLRSVNVVVDSRKALQHAIRVVDVAFEVPSLGWISSSQMAIWMKATLLHTALPMTLRSVLKARLFFHSSKIHRVVGATEFVARRSSAEAQYLDDLAWWVGQGCELDLDDPEAFLFARGASWVCTWGARRNTTVCSIRHCRRADITHALKEAAVALGCSPSFYSSKSWRIAAATLMRALGQDEEAIRAFGNWTSSASYIYEHNQGHEQRPLSLS